MTYDDESKQSYNNEQRSIIPCTLKIFCSI